MVRIEWETEITGTPACLATRSAVRWRVPVSTVGMAGSGIRWTLAQRMREAVSSRTMAPSILASSERRWAVNGTSIWNPPVNRASTWGGEPSTISAPVLALRIRSSPGRRAVPGATWRSTSSSRSSMLIGAPPPASAGAGPRAGPWPGPTATRPPTRPGPARSRRSLAPSGRPVAGTRARRKPSRAASARRRGSWGTGRTSPPRPTSPMVIRSDGHLPVAGGRGQGQADGQVGGGLGDPDPAGGGGEHVVAGQADAGPAVEHGDQDGQPPGVQPLGGAPGHGHPGGHDQRLDLGDERPPALQADRAGDPGHPGRAGGQEQPRRVGQRLQAGLGHLEAADLVGGPEAVLGAADQAQGVVLVALEVEDHVDQVLEGLGAGDGAVLGDLADQEGGDGALLGQPHQLGGDLADLADPAGGAGQLGVGHGLDRVDHHHGRPDLLDQGADGPQVGLGGQQQPRVQGPQPLGPEADLLARLLGADVQHRAVGGEAGQHPQQQGRLADAGLAGQQHHRPGDQAAAEDAVELLDAGGPVGAGLGGDLGDGDRGGHRAGRPGRGGSAPAPPRPGCSRRRRPGSGRPSAGWRPRTRCRHRRSGLSWPYDAIAPTVGPGLPARTGAPDARRQDTDRRPHQAKC